MTLVRPTNLRSLYSEPGVEVAFHRRGTHNSTPVEVPPKEPLRPQLVKSVSGLSIKDSAEELLFKIDSIWRENKLFVKSHNPEDSFYYEYLSDLQYIAESNEREFVSLNDPVSIKKSRSSFLKEFVDICNKTDLSAFQRSILATQALELALLGANPTRVLINIKASNNGNIGYRNELLAGWFLAKFIYELSPTKPFKFVHSEMLPTIHDYRRDKETKEEKLTRMPHSFVREIDISANDSLTSVKSGRNHFIEQISDLFFVVADNNGINGSNLKYRIKKLILIKTVEKPEHLSPNYKHSQEYQNLKATIVSTTRNKIEELYPPETQPANFQDCYKRLISTHGISIYYLPHIESEKDKASDKDWTIDFKIWLKNNYAELDKANSLLQTA